MLDKNPEKEFSGDIVEIKNILEQYTMSSILYSNPFFKSIFLKELLDVVDRPIIYLDFDLLYTGYTCAGIIPIHPQIALFQPNERNWNETLKSVLLRISMEKSIVIIDSLNGLFSLLEQKEGTGRKVDACVMLLVCMAQMSNSIILLAGMAKQKDGSDRDSNSLKREARWVLLPTGRHITETKNMIRLYLKRKNSEITTSVLADNNFKGRNFKII